MLHIVAHVLKKQSKKTFIDVILTDVSKMVQGGECFDTGLSDFHHMVLFPTRVICLLETNGSHLSYT